MLNQLGFEVYLKYMIMFCKNIRGSLGLVYSLYSVSQFELN